MPSTMRIITGEDIYVQVYFYRSRLVNSHQKTVANFNLLVKRITTAWNTDIKYDHYIKQLNLLHVSHKLLTQITGTYFSINVQN